VRDALPNRETVIAYRPRGRRRQRAEESVLSPRPANEPRREVPDNLPHFPVFFTCDDI
jgi:hypothetical protein